MKNYNAKFIRNVALTGHSGSGKTSVAEAVYYITGNSDRLGKTADGNTVCDFDTEEIKRKVSVSTSVMPIEWHDTKINFIDTPGQFDFIGGLREGIRAAGSTVIVLSGKSGVTVGAEKAFEAASEKGIAKLFFINKLDHEHADFYNVLEQLKIKFGPQVCPIVVPYVEDHKVQCYVNMLENKAFVYKDGKPTEVPIPDMGHRLEGLRTAMYEAVAETSEELMEKYFSGEPFTPDELIMGLASGVRKGEIAPVFCGSAMALEGIDLLLNGLIWLAPWAETVAGEVAVDKNGNDVPLKVDENGKTAAIVFKTVADPFVGKLLYFKVVSGKVKADSTLLNPRTGETEKIGKLYTVCGKKQDEVPFVAAGDIGAVAKLANTRNGDTLCSTDSTLVLPQIAYDVPMLTVAVSVVKKGEEEKLAQGMARIVEEDPTVTFRTHPETHEQLLSGMGEQHIDVIISKLKSKFGVDVTYTTPKVAYRETIRKSVKVQGKHKKQSGGHGQYGDVWIEFSPCDSDDLVFEESVFGGSVPKNYFPAVEKGLRESALKGVLANFPMVGVKAVLVDGSYHPVDSSEMAFKLAANAAYKAGIPQASPVLLEPIDTVSILVPTDDTGDIMGDITKRRGRVLGMTPEGKNMTRVDAEVPESEIQDYSTYLRSRTQGRSSFTTEFARYEEVPAAVAEKIKEQYSTDEG